MESLGIFLFLLSSSILSVSALNADGSFSDKARKQAFGSAYSLTWEVDPVAKYVTFETAVKTAGFVGFGISKEGNMFPGDIFYGGVFPNGTAYSADLFATEHAKPATDEIQNWDLISATEKGGVTTLKFGRPFITNDTTQDIPIDDKDTFFIWSFGTTDALQYHNSNRGQFPVNILMGDKEEPPKEDPNMMDPAAKDSSEKGPKDKDPNAKNPEVDSPKSAASSQTSINSILIALMTFIFSKLC